jgi:hypothetical protein
MSEKKYYQSCNATRPLTLKDKDGQKREFIFEKTGLYAGAMRGIFETDNPEHQAMLDEAVEKNLILSLTETNYQYWLEKKSEMIQNSHQVTEITGKKPEPPKPALPAEDKSEGHSSDDAGSTEKISSEPESAPESSEPAPAPEAPAEEAPSEAPDAPLESPAPAPKKGKGKNKK